MLKPLDALLESLLCPDRYATVYCMNKERERLACLNQGDCEFNDDKGDTEDTTPRALTLKLKITPILQELFAGLMTDEKGRSFLSGYLSPFHSVEMVHLLFRPPR